MKVAGVKHIKYPDSVSSPAVTAYSLQAAAFCFSSFNSKCHFLTVSLRIPAPTHRAHSDCCSYMLPGGSENLADLTHRKPAGVRERQAASGWDFPVAPHLSPVSHL